VFGLYCNHNLFRLLRSNCRGVAGKNTGASNSVFQYRSTSESRTLFASNEGINPLNANHLLNTALTRGLRRLSAKPIIPVTSTSNPKIRPHPGSRLVSAAKTLSARAQGANPHSTLKVFLCGPSRRIRGGGAKAASQSAQFKLLSTGILGFAPIGSGSTTILSTSPLIRFSL